MIDSKFAAPAVLLIASLLQLPFARPSSAAVDTGAILEHIHKRYSTPPDLKMTILELGSSPIPGYLTGGIEFEREGRKSVQDIHVSTDGRKYLLAPLYKTKPGEVPGLLVPISEPGKPPPPPIYLTPDGKHVLAGVLGRPEDVSVDPDKETTAKLRLEKVHAKGPANAPVTVVEFSDLQCPHCKNAHELLEQNLPKKYPGKVRWIFKHYPLVNRHPWALSAAMAVSCAGKQKPDAYHRLQSSFFKDQAAIDEKTVRDKSLAYAKETGLDIAAFTRCYDGKESEKLVIADMEEGDSVGVDSTPTIFINGRRAGNYSFETVGAIIEEMLRAR